MRRRACRCRTSNSCSRDRTRARRSAATSIRCRRRTSWRWRRRSVGRSSMAGCRGRRWPRSATACRSGQRVVGQLTPVHLHVGTDQVTLTDPDALALDAGDARSLFDALQPLFGDAGFALHWGDAQRWYRRASEPGRLATASLDRVVGTQHRPLAARYPHRRAPGSACSARPRCCCTAMRSTRGASRRACSAVNSLWLSGCGTLAEPAHAAPQVDDRLRTPALNEDWAAWRDAWHALDAGPIAALLARRRHGHAHAGRRAARAAVHPHRRLALATLARGVAAAGGAPGARRLVTQSTP